MRAKLQILALALGLLALAHPGVVLPLLGIALTATAAAVVAVAGWSLTHLSLTLTIAAGVLLARAFPGRLGRAARWLTGAWIASVAAVAPAKA